MASTAQDFGTTPMTPEQEAIEAAYRAKLIEEAEAPEPLFSDVPNPRDDPAFEKAPRYHPLADREPAPAVQALGLGYAMADREQGIAIHVDRLSESRGQVYGMLSIERSPEGQLYFSHFNLSSSTARTTAARELSARSSGLDWRRALDDFCVAVLAAHSAGAPIERVGRRPRSLEARRLLTGMEIPLLEPTSIYGPQGARKTTFLLGVAVQVATATEIIPGTVCESPGPVLLLDYETNRDEVNDRVARIAEGAGIEPPEIFYRWCHRPLVDQVEELSAFVAAEHVQLVVVDSVSGALAAKRDGGDPNDAVIAMYLAARAIGSTFVFIDHVAAVDYLAGEEKPIRKSIGGIMKGARARAVYELKAARDSLADEAEIVLRCEKLNDGPKPPALGFRVKYDGARGPITFEHSGIDADELVAATLGQAERLRRYLLANGAHKTGEIAEELGIAPSAIRTVLTRDGGRQFTRLHDGRIGVRAHAA